MMKYIPVTVSVTWIVSSPAVLFTQQRYLPLSSKRAYLKKNLNKGHCYNLFQTLYFLSLWKKYCGIWSFSTHLEIDVINITPSLKREKLSFYGRKENNYENKKIHSKMKTILRCFLFAARVTSKHWKYDVWVRVCVFMCVCSKACTDELVRIFDIKCFAVSLDVNFLFKSIKFNYKLVSQ